MTTEPISDMAIIPTRNGYGWTSTVPNQITLALLEFLSAKRSSQATVLDVGAGYGVATLPALRTGARVIANDLDEFHLDCIRAQALSEGRLDQLETVRGYFPGDLKFERLSAIHCSNVLHFMPGAEIVRTAERIYESLKPRGKVFIQVGTIYAGHIKRLVPLFEQRRRNGIRWAGETHEAKAYVHRDFADATPAFMNYLDGDPLVQAFEAVGFCTEKAWYYTRNGIPEQCKNDGREHFGYIGAKGQFARKPTEQGQGE